MNEQERQAAVQRVIARGSDPEAIAEAEGDFGPGGAFGFQPAGMFGTLTPVELETLATKLSRAGGAFFSSADAIGNTALYLNQSGRISALSPEWNGRWALRDPIVDAMDEMHALMSEADAAARSHRAGA